MASARRWQERLMSRMEPQEMPLDLKVRTKTDDVQQRCGGEIVNQEEAVAHCSRSYPIIPTPTPGATVKSKEVVLAETPKPPADTDLVEEDRKLPFKKRKYVREQYFSEPKRSVDADCHLPLKKRTRFRATTERKRLALPFTMWRFFKAQTPS